MPRVPRPLAKLTMDSGCCSLSRDYHFVQHASADSIGVTYWSHEAGALLPIQICPFFSQPVCVASVLRVVIEAADGGATLLANVPHFVRRNDQGSRRTP